MEGRVTYLDGSPAERIRVSISTYLFPESPDFSESDRQRGAALTGVKRKDGSIHRVTRKSVYTNHEGRYQAYTPLGLEYMVEVKSPFAYESHRFMNGQLDSEGRIVQDFRIPTELDSLSMDTPRIIIEVLDENGNALPHVKVTIFPRTDSPWFRSFPEISTGEEGYVACSWVSLGDELNIGVQHESWDNFPCVFQTTVTSDRIQVRIQECTGYEKTKARLESMHEDALVE